MLQISPLKVWQHSCTYMGTSPVETSNLTPILKYDRGPSPAIMAKILVVDCQQFLCNTLFYFVIFFTMS
jgi:hypothetical protein